MKAKFNSARKYAELLLKSQSRSLTSARLRSVDRVKRQAASPADILRLLKQPVGPTRVAVRAADYMNNALMLISSMTRRNKRSINATGPSSGSFATNCTQTFLTPYWCF